MNITVDGVIKVFHSDLAVETIALRDLSFTVNSGEFWCILGPSGCGKSTLLNIIAGFEPPTEGTVIADGRVVTRPSVDRMVVFQDVQGAIMPWLTALRNVEFALKMAKRDKESRRDIAREALRSVGLSEAEDKYPHELSGGMQQRVQIARALALRPRSLLLDEPFGALDFLTRSALQMQLQELHMHSPRTTLFITHDLSEAALLADKVLVMGPDSRSRGVVDIATDRPRRVADDEVVNAVRHLTGLIDRPA